MYDPQASSQRLKRAIKARQLWFRITFPLHRILARRRRPYAGKLIGITGSVGKTTAATLLGQILRPYGKVATGVATNTPHHVLRTIRKLREPVDFVVQEVSGMPPGSIPKLTAIVDFDGAIITTVGTDHIAAFRDIEAIAAEKAKLATSIAPSGFVCLNADDALVAAMAPGCRARVITYGMADTALVRATAIEARWPNGLRFTLVVDGNTYPVVTRLHSSVYLPSVLGVLAAVHGLGLDLQPAIAALAEAKGHSNRFELRHAPGGHSYILDTVKASHWSTLQVLERIDELEIPDLIIVLGQLSDFKNDSSRQYRKIIRNLAERGYPVIAVGPAANSARKVAAEGFAHVWGFGRREEVIDHLATLAPGVVLLKGGDILPLNMIAEADTGRLEVARNL